MKQSILILSMLMGLCVGLPFSLAGSATAEKPAPGPSAEKVHFTFEDIDIKVLIKLVGEQVGRRFVVDDSVEGKVTVVTPGKIDRAEIYPLFLSVMESSGYSVVKQGDVHRVVALPEGGLIRGPVIGPDDEMQEGVITKVLRVEHISVLELRKTLEPMVRGAKEGALSAFAPANHLVVTDTAQNIRRLQQIIAELDRPGSARSVEVVSLKNAAADAVARQVTAALRGAEQAENKLRRHVQNIADGGGSLPSDAVVVPAEHANSLLLVGTPVQLRELKNIIELLDVEGPGHGRFNAIFLNYLSAEDAAKSLNALLAKNTNKEKAGQIGIEPNLSNNALLVDASPRDFEWIKQLVESLDQEPQQVLVEIIIAELSDSEGLDLGMEWATIDDLDSDSPTILGRSRPGPTDTLLDTVANSMFPQGMLIGIARGTTVGPDGSAVPRVPFLIRAQAEDRGVKILSNVPLWAQNNTEATVSVVENIPILKSTIQGGAGTARDVIQNIERVDVGIKLKFTPHVNPNDEVTMELNPSIEAIIDQGSVDTPFTPTIAKREVSTTVTVQNEATIAISGLIRDDEVNVVSKVPILGDIPILGHLFRNTVKRKQRTNLLILVTPHIIHSLEEAASLRAAMEEKTQLEGMHDEWKLGEALEDE